MRPLVCGAAAGIALVLVACSQAAREAPPSAPSKPTALESRAVPIADGEWERIARAPVAWYRPEGSFWIEDRVVVVAASTVQSWDRDTGKWSVLAEIPQAGDCEGCGYSETAVWTGSEILLWGGGFGYRAPDGTRHAGVSVDLDGDVQPLPKAPIPIRWWHQAVWTGIEMIVFGGGRDSHARRDGAAYDPSTRTWRALPKAPVGGYANSLVWTGKEMISWGGIRNAASAQGYPAGFVLKGAAYDPETDTWRVLAPSELDPRGWHTAVWTGKEMIVWGGVAESSSDCYDCGYATDAAAYNPRRDSWRGIEPGPLSGRVEHTAVWTGRWMIVYGGSAPGGGAGKGDGAAYDLRTATWSLLPEAPMMGRYRHATVWTGVEMIVWGGQRPNGQGFANGAAYNP